MKRRDFIALAGTAVIAPRVAIAQTPGKVYRLALVSPGGLLPESDPFAKILLGGLVKLGYTPGQNLAFEGPLDRRLLDRRSSFRLWWRN